ncbi:MAG: hypothetical protein GY833_21740 [Aestuariibacter sp.]|nr:hypothetical protein [Aestuariibacter sp.]|tara:strand:+ start:107427 stop:107720 length:294 start_codon:yes stop_codon:yes gene_type:complete
MSKSRAELILEKAGIRQQTILDLLLDAKANVVKKSNPSSSEELTKAIIAFVYKKAKELEGTVSAFYNALGVLLTKNARKGIYLKVDQQPDLDTVQAA